MKKRLKFEDTDEDGHEFDVYNKKKEYLGWCQYDEDWKCWTFSQADSNTYGVTAFSSECLREIADFLKKQEEKNGRI